MAMILFFAALVMLMATYRMVTDLLAGHPLWYYSGTAVIFAFALLGLVLIVKEGWLALTNLVKYGLHPRVTEEDYEEFRQLTGTTENPDATSNNELEE